MARIITIDPSGRLVIPRELRRRFHLHSGARLRLIEEGERLVLVPVGEEATLTEKDGLLIAHSTPVGEWLDHRELREQRLDSASELRRGRKS